MKSLNGLEMVGYIKERQAKQVRSLRQSKKIIPKLSIIVCTDSPVINTYVAHKQSYGQDILVDVDVHKINQNDALDLIIALNKDQQVDGIIIQLPLIDTTQTDELVNAVDSAKDVDGLGQSGNFEPATPTAIMWLLYGYNIELMGKNIVIVGRGRLVGSPLKKMMEKSGLNAQVIHSQTQKPKDIFNQAHVIITAAGKPGIITESMIPQNCVVVDAAVASEDGVLSGDLADDVYKRKDLTVTPKKGGVGPLTVCALFDNVIRAAQLKSKT